MQLTNLEQGKSLLELKKGTKYSFSFNSVEKLKTVETFRPDLSNTPPNFYVRFRAAINLQAGEEGDKMIGECS